MRPCWSSPSEAKISHQRSAVMNDQCFHRNRRCSTWSSNHSIRVNPLLWAGFRTARVKMTICSIQPKLFCVTNVPADSTIQTDGPRVGDPCCNTIRVGRRLEMICAWGFPGQANNLALLHTDILSTFWGSAKLAKLFVSAFPNCR